MEINEKLNTYYNMLNTLNWQIKTLKGYSTYNNSKKLLIRIKAKENRINKLNTIINNIVKENNISKKDQYYIKITGLFHKEIKKYIKIGYAVEDLITANNLKIQRKL